MSSTSLAPRLLPPCVEATQQGQWATGQSRSRAFERIVVAQKAKEYDMDGHAQNAKELLYLVNAELKMAAEATNKSAQ